MSVWRLQNQVRYLLRPLASESLQRQIDKLWLVRRIEVKRKQAGYGAAGARRPYVGIDVSSERVGHILRNAVET